METKIKKQTKVSENKKLSKVGEWLESGQTIGCTYYDLKAILR